MKYRPFTGFLVFILALTTSLAGCRDGSQVHSLYETALPALPDGWRDILGEPCWHLEWIGEEGTWNKWEGRQGAKAPSLSLVQEWTTPVLAWPYWPGLDLVPGIMRPCGALFPWDASGNKLVLSWKGGVDAVFWKEMAAIDADKSETAKSNRIPWLFDWPRFREIIAGENVSDAVRQDPWVVDWREVGRKTVESGFDRRRIKAMKSTEVEIPLPAGLWLSSSPFVSALETPVSGRLTLEVTDAVGVWVSAGGILKASTSGWIFRPW